MEHRPDPDALLAAVKKEEARQGRGRLKIFFGMAAGVGKTFAMLEAAHQQLAEGVDVVVAFVETHGRGETEALLQGLPAIPRRHHLHRTADIEEMDLDAVLARRPQLALVDELAHTNVPGIRHPKRYQDVLELLDAGIDVFTTLNVQHLESRADTVRQITGARVHETVPDSVFETADEIQLIDLDPAKLRQRLAVGKVYVPESAEVAAANFFRLGNLTALREMALRLTAERVDHELREYMHLKHIAGPWKSGERLMVAVSPSPLSERLVRWTRRMAYTMEAPWLAVYVETPSPLSPQQQARLQRNLALARELGGEVLVSADRDTAQALIRFARQHNVTQIVIGKPDETRLQEILRGGSLVDRLVRASGDIDVYVVRGDRSEVAPREGVPEAPQGIPWSQYALALGVVAGAVGLNLLAVPFIGYTAVALVLLFTISVLAAFVDRGPTLMAAALTALLWDLLFIPPRFTFMISRIEDALMFVMYFIIALVMGSLTARLRTQERLVRRREERTAALYALAHDVARAATMEEVLGTAVNRVGATFGAEVAIFRADPAGVLAAKPDAASTWAPDEKEFSVAAWTFGNRRAAGRHTDTLPSANGLYLPLLAHGDCIGVLAIRQPSGMRMGLEQETLLETFAGQIALAMERELLDAAAEHAAVVTESERLYRTLLNSVSHELRTPIAAITGAASGLLDPNTNQPSGVLVKEIQAAADRLNLLVENLLDMTRLESGLLRVRRDWIDASDVVSMAVRQTTDLLAQHKLAVELAPGLPLLRADFVLLQQALVNLLHNAAAHTPPGTRVTVRVRQEDGCLLLVVEDCGPGLPKEDPERVFEKFYRAPGAGSGGTGLGLSIVRGLVEAHGGSVHAENMPEGGARFSIRLPLDTPPPVPEEDAGHG
jgi:two-component system sensor histidine kinase KdpD